MDIYILLYELLQGFQGVPQWHRIRIPLIHVPPQKDQKALAPWLIFPMGHPLEMGNL